MGAEHAEAFGQRNGVPGELLVRVQLTRLFGQAVVSYLVAEAMGAQAVGLHAWDIAPARYVRGADGRPVRKG